MNSFIEDATTMLKSIGKQSHQAATDVLAGQIHPKNVNAASSANRNAINSVKTAIDIVVKSPQIEEVMSKSINAVATDGAPEQLAIAPQSEEAMTGNHACPHCGHKNSAA